jgi:hypothetical protein
MDSSLHEQLIRDTESLRALVSECSSETVVGTCCAYALKRSTREESDYLVSPARQLFFLLGLMLTTPEPTNPKDFGEQEWQDSIELFNAIYTTYARMFWPKEEELPNLTDEWTRVREVVMPTFLHYFNTGVLASIEQVSERIRQYFVPFDADLKRDFGISASEALDVADWIAKYLQRSADELVDFATAEKEARLALLDRAAAEGWDLDRLRMETQNSDYGSIFADLSQRLQSFFKVPRSALLEQFGERITNSYWNLYVAKRGQTPDFTYLTERNPAEEKSLFQVEEGVAFCPLSNALYWAILKTCESQLSNSSLRDSYFRKRDKALESEVEGALRRIFGSTAEFYSEVFETEALQHEHDLIVLWNANLFVVEAKASPPLPPFRDPDKAFTRLKRAFQSDRGIQKAHEQAGRIRRQLVHGSSIDLFDSRKNKVVRIESKDVSNIYTICVTRDDFGPLAIDLSLLLEKEEDEPYSWAVNIFDLQTFANAWEHFGWGPDRLCEYLDDRIRLNGKLFASDEMEIAGFFVQHGMLSYLTEAEADRLHLTPDYSDVFDRIYEMKHGGDPVVYAPTEPFMEDMRKLLTDHQVDDPRPITASTSRKKQGRNERCNCGSGKKYKRCCGRQPPRFQA